MPIDKTKAKAKLKGKLSNYVQRLTEVSAVPDATDADYKQDAIAQVHRYKRNDEYERAPKRKKAKMPLPPVPVPR